jgi:hypothetical protein
VQAKRGAKAAHCVFRFQPAAALHAQPPSAQQPPARFSFQAVLCISTFARLRLIRSDRSRDDEEWRGTTEKKERATFGFGGELILEMQLMGTKVILMDRTHLIANPRIVVGRVTES